MDEIAYTYSMILSELFILCGDINDAVIVKKRNSDETYSNNCWFIWLNIPIFPKSRMSDKIFSLRKERIKMKKMGLTVAAATVAAMTIASIPVSAANYNENALKYTPVIDGKIDAAYMESFYIEHEWPSDRDSDHYWGNGKFEFTDLQLDANGNKVEGSIGYNTAYDWDCQATSYFLWDDNNIYIAVRVIDTDVGVIDDAHYAMACEDTINWGPWLQDGVSVYLAQKGMTFTVRADRAGRYVTVYREDNYGEQVWCDLASWSNHDANRQAGYFATTGDAGSYIVEMCIPVSEAQKSKVLKDNGNFKYGISVIDAGANSPYGLDQARLAEGEEVEGYNLDDFMVLSDCLNSVDGKPDQKIVLSTNVPTVQPEENAGPGNNVVNNGGTGSGTNNVTNEGAANNGASNNGGTSGSTIGSGTSNGAVQTGDVGIAVAATSIIAAACFIAIKKRR